MITFAFSQRVLALTLIVPAVGSYCRAADIPYTFEIRDGGKSVDVTGFAPAAVDALVNAQWKTEKWATLFALYVEPSDGSDATKRPAVLGSYEFLFGRLRFTPRFPLSPGVSYRAVFHPDGVPGVDKPAEAVVKTLLIPKPERAEATAVDHIYPSADKLPENQLKFYLHFSSPMSRGEAYRCIYLFDADGKEIERAFLEVGEELWDRENKRFTLFIDPGRIKRGLKPREDLGPVLEMGKAYTLVVDREWKDAEGDPLKKTFRKKFTASAAEETPPDPKTWRLTAPVAGGKAPLVVALPRPMENALLHRMVWVTDAAGHAVAGEVVTTDAETRWRFTPRDPWAAGSYHLVADARLEDLAGNTLGRPFEVDVFDPTKTETKVGTVETPFEVVAPKTDR